MPKFSVTYGIVTQESAEYGDTEESGFIVENVPFREAFAEVHNTRTNRVDGVIAIEADEYPVRCPRWITIDNGMEFETGAHESRSLHIPDGVTRASRLRIARLFNLRIG